MAGRGTGKKLAVAFFPGPAAGMAMQVTCAGAARVGQTAAARARASLLAVWRGPGARPPGIGDDGDRFGSSAWG